MLGIWTPDRNHCNFFFFFPFFPVDQQIFRSTLYNMASLKTTAFILIYVFNLFAIATAYLNEAAPPFTILTPKSGQSVKRGSNVTVTW